MGDGRGHTWSNGALVGYFNCTFPDRLSQTDNPSRDVNAKQSPAHTPTNSKSESAIIHKRKGRHPFVEQGTMRSKLVDLRAFDFYSKPDFHVQPMYPK